MRLKIYRSPFQPKHERTKIAVKIDKDKCTGCGKCINVCLVEGDKD